MALILISNDDGINARGLEALKEATQELGETIVFAPDSERSASSHSLTIHESLKVNQISKNVFSTDGTPTDCILYSVRGILDKKPSLVLGGINQGANLGQDILYSGTVAIAMEGTLLKIPSAAFSWVNFYESFDKEIAKKVVKQVTKRLLSEKLPEGIFLNVNIPPRPNGKYKITKLGNRVYRDSIILESKEENISIYSLGGPPPSWIPEEGTDFNAVEDGYISITPIHLEYTAFNFIKKLTKWEEELEL